MNHLKIYLKRYLGSGAVATTVYSIILFAFVSLQPSFAAEPTTLFDACAMALDSHEAIAIAGEELIRSERSIDKAYSTILPSVTAEGTYTKYSDQKSGGSGLIQPDDATSFELRVEQPLYRGGREMSGIRQAKKGAAAMRAGLSEESERIVIETARAYYGVLKTARDVDIENASLGRALKQQEASKARLRAGTATRTVVLRAEA